MTLFFFDEIQEIPELVTQMKFLVEDGRFRYILSGALLGVELKGIRLLPVGYMDIYDMYPLDFEESINERFLKLFNLYVIIGGMPEAGMM